MKAYDDLDGDEPGDELFLLLLIQTIRSSATRVRVFVVPHRMKFAPWIRFVFAAIALGIALIFLGWLNHRRIQRIEYVSALPGRAETPDVTSDHSLTGYANAQRELIVPEGNETSYAWISETQQMLSERSWRVRRVVWDNAPAGRDVYSTSPYRWWLGFVVEADHAFTGRAVGLSVEDAALLADPLMHVLFLIGAAVLIAWRWGALPAGLFCVGAVALFPFAAGFLPGVPDHRALARLCALASTLLLITGLRDARQARTWFALAGLLGGIGLWVDAPTLVPILSGTIGGVLLGLGLEKWRSPQRHDKTSTPDIWRVWGLSGGATVLAAYLIEYSPDFLGSWRLQALHPLYGLAWIGAGELLNTAANASSGIGKKGISVSGVLRVVLASSALAAVPLAIHFLAGEGLFTRDAFSYHLTLQPSGIVATTTAAWIARDGASRTTLATLLPFLLLVPLAWLAWRRATLSKVRLGLAVALGPTLVTLGVASLQLAWWGLAGGLLLVAIVAAAPAETALYPEKNDGSAAKDGRVKITNAGFGSRSTGALGTTRPTTEPRMLSSSDRWYRFGAAAVMFLLVLPGVRELRPEDKPDASLALTSAETQQLIERHLAHWLAKQSGEPGTTVYAPPHATASLAYFGSLRGIGTFAPENRAGFGVALMIAAANTLEEAQALLQTRAVRYVVVPSWDPFFDNFAELYLDQRFAGRTSFLVSNLRKLKPPVWLRPIAYQMPEVKGFEGQSLLVFELVEDQSPALAESRLAEYLVEMGRTEQALAASEDLRRFPGDLGALSARAQIAIAREDGALLAQLLNLISERVANGGDRYLAWDRRVSLAIVLARGNRLELAQVQLKKCIDQTTTEKLRQLSPSSLYRLLVLREAMNVPFANSELQRVGIELLPVELRSRL